ncbi:hypothetical protein U1Q18_012967 [Sarracenia purpurea var. burkii]
MLIFRQTTFKLLLPSLLLKLLQQPFAQSRFVDTQIVSSVPSAIKLLSFISYGAAVEIKGFGVGKEGLIGGSKSPTLISSSATLASSEDFDAVSFQIVGDGIGQRRRRRGTNGDPSSSAQPAISDDFSGVKRRTSSEICSGKSRDFRRDLRGTEERSDARRFQRRDSQKKALFDKKFGAWIRFRCTLCFGTVEEDKDLLGQLSGVTHKEEGLAVQSQVNHSANEELKLWVYSIYSELLGIKATVLVIRGLGKIGFNIG